MITLFIFLIMSITNALKAEVSDEIKLGSLKCLSKVNDKGFKFEIQSDKSGFHGKVWKVGKSKDPYTKNEVLLTPPNGVSLTVIINNNCDLSFFHPDPSEQILNIHTNIKGLFDKLPFSAKKIRVRWDMKLSTGETLENPFYRLMECELIALNLNTRFENFCHRPPPGKPPKIEDVKDFSSDVRNNDGREKNLSY